MKSVKAMVFVVYILTGNVLWAAFPHSNGNSSMSHWRSPEYGGINALYCYLHINGINCLYSNLFNEQASAKDGAKQTPQALASLAAKYGRPLHPVFLTLKDLTAGTLPLIVFVDGETPNRGAFLLVISVSDQAVDFINGPTASIHEMTLENFTRTWNGVALVPVMNRQKYLIALLVGFAVGTTPFLCRPTIWRRAN